ncbi:SMC family ATPase [Candidatus Bathyarchaeota archaeon]|nr:SMC family ATPase [Candidatus Bathyarchaeota archaeon]
MLESLTLRGFKSYKSRQLIHFTSGVNKISGRNATGKTTILEAILFALYGEVPGVNKKDLVTIGQNELSVSLSFRNPITNQKAVISRSGQIIQSNLDNDESFKSTDLFLDIEGDKVPLTRERDIQERLREFLGIGRRTFLNVVYARQKEFIDILNPDKNRMNAILGLTTPTEIKEELREVKKILEEKGNLKDKNAFLERIRNAEESIKENNLTLTENHRRREKIVIEYEKNRKELILIKEKLTSIENLDTNLRNFNKKRSEHEIISRLFTNQTQKLSELMKIVGDNPEENLVNLLKRQKTAESTEERLRLIVEEELSDKRRVIDIEIGKLEHKIIDHNRLSSSGLSTCPTCGQQIDKQLITFELSTWTIELEENKSKLVKIMDEIKEVNNQAKIAREKRIEIERRLTDYKSSLKQVEDIKTELSTIEKNRIELTLKLKEDTDLLLTNVSDLLNEKMKDIELAQHRVEVKLKNLRDTYSTIFSSVKTNEGLISETDRGIKELESRLNTQKKVLIESKAKIEQIEEYEEKIRVIDYIIDQYGIYEKDIRENTLRRLEDWTFEYFKKLTDQQLYNRCVIDREKYTLEVQLKDTRRTIPVWRAGGGHESIFALAERLALLRVAGFSRLLILDEPTDAIDSDNIPQLLEYISKSSREIEQILIVTHHGQGEDDDVNLLTVSKEEGESKVSLN